jgi:hypothetical protein
MRKVNLSILLLLFTYNIYAQKWETIAELNSGFFHFVGSGVDQTSHINQADPPGHNYTNNPYGSKDGLCYGLGVNLQRVTPFYFVYGLNLNWESLQSKAALEYKDNNQVSWSGRTFLRSNFLTITPHLGFKVPCKTFEIEASVGIDFAIPVFQAKERGKATSSDGQIVRTNLERSRSLLDLRSSFQLAAYFNRYGLRVGQAIGKFNYLSGYAGAGTEEIFSRHLKIGLQYRLSK